MEPIYVVSGYMRSGTSMMMHALEAGGFETLKNSKRDTVINNQCGDSEYQPNPNGFYEDAEKWSDPSFPKGNEGKLVKVLSDRAVFMPVGNYKVVFMLRDPEEIRQSYEAAFNKKAPGIGNYYKMTERVTALLKNRKDTNLVTLNYRDVVDNPRQMFEKLQAQGWEFNIDKAVDTIDTGLCRFRKENLDIGI